MTIALSVEKILQSVYAYSALQFYTRTDEVPDILGRAHEAMLKILIESKVASLAAELMPAVEYGGCEGDIIALEVRPVDRELPFVIQSLFEAVVAARVMTAWFVHLDTDVAKIYGDISDKNMIDLRAMLFHPGCPGRIAPAV